VRLPTREEILEAETIQRIPCNISRHDFAEKFESRQTPVILEGCTKNWPAQKRWDSFQSFALRFDNDMLWNNCGHYPQLWSEFQEEMIPNKGFLCLFDPIGMPESISLFDDYKIPLPFQGANLYAQLPNFDRLAWFSLGETTGYSDPHQDFHLPHVQWNTVVRGTKWCKSIAMPLMAMQCHSMSIPFNVYTCLLFSDVGDLYPITTLLKNDENILCDVDCSEDENLAWFARVTFHANKFIYKDGKCPLHVLQQEGDTLYIPAQWMHSLLNLEDCITVTEAYGSPTNVAEIWK